MACLVSSCVGFDPSSPIGSYRPWNSPLIRGAKVKIDKPDKFEGNATELSNWLVAV